MEFLKNLNRRKFSKQPLSSTNIWNCISDIQRNMNNPSKAIFNNLFMKALTSA